jgi:ABC-type nitrate/sulfonate/bicarbonate transport system permease component
MSTQTQAPPAPATTPTPARAGGSRNAWRSIRRILISIGGAILSIAVICAFWQGVVSGFGLDPFITRGPLQVWDYLTASGNGAERHILIEASVTTGRDAIIGMVSGTVVAMVAAIVFVLYKPIEQTVMPVAMALRAVPLVAMTPLIALVFGRGLLSVTVIAGIVTFFPVLVNVVLALRAVPASQFDLMRAYGASPLVTLLKVQLPSALPPLFAALRMAAPLALVGALLAEWLTTGKGLGYLMLQSVTTFELDRMWAAVTIVTVASILLYSLISAIEQITLARYAPDRTTRTV